jgi:hypothetical protein
MKVMRVMVMRCIQNNVSQFQCEKSFVFSPESQLIYLVFHTVFLFLPLYSHANSPLPFLFFSLSFLRFVQMPGQETTHPVLICVIGHSLS